MSTPDTTPIAKLTRPVANSPVLVGTTDFSRLTRNQKSVWVKQMWKHARNYSFVMRFAGSSVNSMIQRITELTASEKGEKAIIQLIQDLTGQGVTGDYALEGREEEIRSFDSEITIDQLRNATRNVGRMTDQRNVINFREQSKDKLGYWIADTIDQLGFLTLSGVPYHYNTNGSLRVSPKGATPQAFPGNPLTIGSFSGTNNESYGYGATHKSGTTLSELEFAKRVHLPTPSRCFRWKNTDARANPKIKGGDGELIALKDEAGASLPAKRVAHLDEITKDDYLSYAALLAIRTELKTQYMRGIRGTHGDEFYHIFIHPKAYLRLKKDPDYRDALKYAANRGSSNPIFSGGTVTLDGMVIHEYQHVFNTLGSAPEMKAGKTKGVDTKANKAIAKAVADAVTAAKTALTDAEKELPALATAIKTATDAYEAEKAQGKAPTTALGTKEVEVHRAKAAYLAKQEEIKKLTIDYIGAVTANKKSYGGVDYCRVLFCGAQALGMCTLDGVTPMWVEKNFDYDNSMGIASGKIFGFEKPQFPSRASLTDPSRFMENPYDNLEDFGVAVLDVAI